VIRSGRIWEDAPGCRIRPGRQSGRPHRPAEDEASQFRRKGHL